MPDDALIQVKPYLDEIANRLWSNNAAVMVGAGFSQNAETVGSTTESLPNWKQLGDLFYRKLHGQSPGEEERYLSLLKLAEQVRAAFGRPALNNLLQRAIPDLRYAPSKLHSELLGLPWKDVFTTNFDTLLERARATVTLRHYAVVATKEDLLYANGPRIVKLHGSFPSPPFVVTEEDYRRYPIDHAPFVNTVRQSLLENTLCLIGFSGDDPNFLQWIGWIRDHLGKENIPKIYLVGVFDKLSEAERRLLDGRGIVTVDLSVVDRDPGAALSVFMEYLRGRRTRALDWPTVSGEVSPEPGRISAEKIGEIVAEWRRQRDAYPGWIVVPEDRRQVLWQHTETWLPHLWQISPEVRAKLETPLDLDLAFELTWRLDRCLFPLGGNLPALLEDIAAKYGDPEFRLPDSAGWTSASVPDAVANIRMWLLRHYREEGLQANWNEVRQAVKGDLERLLPEQRARFQLEEALQALFLFDLAEAKGLLADWQTNEHLPFWEAKRAALMAELGEPAAARPILESSLLGIRKQIGLNPIAEDCTLVSQESVAMLLLYMVERGMTMTQPDSEAGSLLGELSERWSDLTRYKCDPRREMESFTARLRHPGTEGSQESTTHHFDLGIVSNTFHFGTDREVVAAYGLLRLLEDLSVPYRMENMLFVSEPVKATLSRAGPHSPHWALVNIARLGDTKATDHLFNREFLAGLGRDDVDGYMQTYLAALERTVSMVDDPDWSEAKTFVTLAETLPEVFSRLCYKCSPVFRERMVDTLGAIYGSSRKHVFDKVGRFASRLFDSMSVQERIRAVPSLIDFPVPEGLQWFDERHFINPVLLLKLSDSVQAETIAVSEERVDELLEQLAGDAPTREWAATSLAWLNEKGKLDGRQSERLGSLLWKRVDATEVPVVPGFYSFACMTLPHPAEVDPEPRVKKHLLSIVAEQAAGSNRDHVLDELRNSAGIVKWSGPEALDLLAGLSGWWNHDKHLLHRQIPGPFGSLAAIPKRTAAKIVNALSAVFSHVPAGPDGHERLDPLHGFVSDLRQHGIAVTRLEAASCNMVADGRADVLHRVATGMLDREHDHVADALAAAEVLAQVLPEEERDDFNVVATKLVQGVEWRHRPALAARLRVAAQLVERQPWFLSEETKIGLLVGLEQLVEETSSGVKGNDVDGVIAIRSSAASLAFALFGHYEASGLELPEAIQRWRELCSAPDEFTEVRNSWTDTDG